MTIGEFAVDMFLAISGYLVTRSWEVSRSTSSFLVKRVLRLYPAFLVLMAVQAFVLAPLSSREIFGGYTARQLGLLAFEAIDLVGYGFPYGGLLTTFPDNPLPLEMNVSLWTIRYEFLCYLLLAVGGAAFRRTWFLGALFTTVLTVFVIGWLPPWHWVLTGAIGAVEPWPRLLSFFLAGVLFYRVRERIPHDTRLAILATVTIAAVAICWPLGLKLVLPTAGVYLFFWGAYHPRSLRWLRPGVRDVSYGVYLYGFPIQQSVMMWISPVVPMNPIRLAATAAGASILAGFISWHAIEKPFLTLKPRGRQPEPISFPRCCDPSEYVTASWPSQADRSA
jgi:peptidoglycan/LPS O-acetylase OafA/YrhL